VTAARLYLLCLLFVAPGLALSAADATDGKFRGGKVEWARLQAGPEWNRHAATDHVLLEFMRDSTSLNIDPQWKSASPHSLPELCAYPFLYATSIASLSSAETRNRPPPGVPKPGKKKHPRPW
jgi:hypothetical protein